MGAAAPAPVSASRFAWETLGGPAWPPPVPGPDPVCYLCGGPTENEGWPRRQAIPPTFTNVNLAAAPASGTVCQACAYLGSGAAWQQYAAAHPQMGLKAAHPLSWRSYSHVFAAGLHACPTRRQWRTWLLEPPDPPFLFVVAESGQKHLIFRAAVAHSRDVFPVQVEETRVYVDRARFAACLAAFEALYRLGCSRDAIRTGDYPPHQVLRAGVTAWRPAEASFAPWRQREPGLVRLAHRCAQREED